MSTENNKSQEPFGNRTQVAKNKKHAKIKDKLLFAGVVVICIVIAVGGLIPKHKANTVMESSEKQNAVLALSQNMELIAALKEKSKQYQSGYHGGDPSHPPILRGAQTQTITKETLARMNAPSTFFSQSSDESSASTIMGVKKDRENAYRT